MRSRRPALALLAVGAVASAVAVVLAVRHDNGTKTINVELSKARPPLVVDPAEFGQPDAKPRGTVLPAIARLKARDLTRADYSIRRQTFTLAVAAQPTKSDSSNTWLWVIVAGVLSALAVLAAAYAWRRRQRPT
jgi:hypothetical protein